MANKRKILENARKLVQKGAKERALKEYNKLLKLDPRDAKLRLEIGDAHRRWGQIDEAIATYEAVAAQYAKEGFDARAVAVYKQIVTLDAEHYAAYEPLAEIYERMGLAGEALGALQTAADALNHKGDRHRALDLLRKMAMMDPTNTTSRMKVAELLRQEGRDSEATSEYLETATELERQGDLEGSGRALVAILEMSPDHLVALKGVARSMIAQNAPDKAVSCAQRVLEIAPDEVDHYELLADALRRAGREDELSAVYRGLVSLHRERGDEDRAREIAQRYVAPEELAPSASVSAPLSVQPGPPAETTVYGGLEGEPLDSVALTEPPFLDPEDGFGDDELLIEDDAAADAADFDASLLEDEPADEDADAPGLAGNLGDLMASPEAEPLAAPLEVPPDAAPEAAALPAELDTEQQLAEASVYLRYGKQDRAISHLEAVLSQEPGHRGALEKLAEACEQIGDTARAVESWRDAAHQAREADDHDGFESLCSRIRAIDESAVTELASAPECVQSAGDATGEIEFDLAGVEADGDELSVDLGGEPAPAVSAGETGDDGSLSTSTGQQIVDHLEEADFYVQQNLLDEAEAIYQRVLAIAPSHPTALVRLGEIAVSRGQDPNDSGRGFAGEEPDLPVEPELTSDDSLEALDLDFEDASFDTDRGHAATMEAFEALERDDGIVELEEPVAERDEEPAPRAVEADPQLAVPTEDGGDSFDLAAELAGALAGTGGERAHVEEVDDGFSAVFSAFKKGVSETLQEGDHQAHYDLGIAYKEMGLFDDAIAEFELAARGASRPGCLHLMGLCALDAGAPADAVVHLEALLACDGLEADASLAAHYDLGRAHAAQGDMDGARRAYRAVLALDPGFRDVADRLQQIGASLPSTTAVPEDEGGFESFEDFFGDGDAESDDLGGIPPLRLSDPPLFDAGALAEAAAEEGLDAPGVMEADLDEEDEQENEEVALDAPPVAAPDGSGARKRRKKKISFV